MEGLNNLISDHPAGVVIGFCVMWGVLMTLVTVVAEFGRRELRRIECKELEQDTRLNKIEERVTLEDTDIKIMSRDLKEHIRREEAVWEKVDEIHDNVLKIGNGQIQTIHQKLDHLSDRMGDVQRRVDSHNEESEGWKRRIEKNDLRLQMLEGRER